MITTDLIEALNSAVHSKFLTFDQALKVFEYYLGIPLSSLK